MRHAEAMWSKSSSCSHVGLLISQKLRLFISKRKWLARDACELIATIPSKTDMVSNRVFNKRHRDEVSFAADHGVPQKLQKNVA